MHAALQVRATGRARPPAHSFIPVPVRNATESEFTKYLTKLMGQAGYDNGPDLARASGIDPSIINRWFREGRIPSIDNMRRIAPLLNVTLAQMMVRAGIITAPELGMATMPQPPTPLPSEVREQLNILDPRNPNFSDREKRAFLRSIGRNTETFLEVVEETRTAPREPRMRRRA